MNGSTSNSATKRARLGKARYLPIGALLAALLPLIGGCIEKLNQNPQEAHQNPPANARIVSGDPSDTAALRESAGIETQVRWGVIERQGPKTAWEQFGFKRDPKKDNVGEITPGSPSGPDPNEVHGTIVNTTFAPPTTRPATTQPTTQPIVVPVYTYPEAGLPVKVQELPDGKVRMIWTLRNFGGTNVASARDAVTSRRTVTLTPPDLAPLTAVLGPCAGPGGTVVPLPRENTVVVTCDRIYRGQVVEMLAKLDVPPRQVQIAARIFEVSHDFDFQQGAQVLAKHLGTDNSQSGTSIFSTQRAIDSAAAGTPFQGSVMSLMKTFEKQGISVEASFQILADAGLIRMVSNPRMTVAAGQTGYLLAGQELPIQTANLVNAVLTTATQYKPVGVQLYITPQAVGPDRVKLHTISIVSSVSGFAPMPSINGRNSDTLLVNPIIDSREAETQVTVHDGDTLVISGLRMSRTTTRENKIPGLGDLPILGWLFKNHRTQQQLTDLYFFVTPTLL